MPADCVEGRCYATPGVCEIVGRWSRRAAMSPDRPL